MMNRQQELIAKLTAGLTPVKRAPPPLRVAGLWWLGSWLFVIVVTLLTGPLRPGAFVQVLTHAQFAAESLVGLLAAALIAAWAFEDSIPGARRSGLLRLGLIGAPVAWLAQPARAAASKAAGTIDNVRITQNFFLFDGAFTNRPP